MAKSSVDSRTAQRVRGVDDDFFTTSEWEVAFVEIDQVLQSFNRGYVLTKIDVKNIDTLEYDKNETGSFTALTITAGEVTTGLPSVVDSDTLTWKITYSVGKDKASMIVKANKV